MSTELAFIFGVVVGIILPFLIVMAMIMAAKIEADSADDYWSER